MQKSIIMFLLAFLLVQFSSCKRVDDNGVDTEFEATGDLLGVDLTLCACCGGYLIKIDGEEGNLNISKLPTDNDLELENANYPIAVKLNWTANISQACPKIISVESIVRE